MYKRHGMKCFQFPPQKEFYKHYKDQDYSKFYFICMFIEKVIEKFSLIKNHFATLR